MTKRKNLLALIGTLILVLSLSVPMMQCAPSGEEVTPPPEEEVTPPEEEVTPPEEEGIKYGGRFNVGWLAVEALEDLRPGQDWQYTEMGCDFWPLVYDQLWIMGPAAPDYEALPMLATSWESEDGKTWTFHLREDAVWHDGVPVTAEDVAFTLEYLPEADPCWAYPDSICEPGSIKAIDDYTVQFTLAAVLGGPYPPFYWVPMLPQHIWEPYKDNITSYANDEAIGSGPFKLKEFKTAQYIWFEANKDYWGERPYVDELVYKTYGSLDTLCMAMEQGKIDLFGSDTCPTAAAEDLKAKGFKVIVSPDLSLDFLSFNLHKEGPIQDLDVRKAIMHAMNIDRIIDMAGLGYGEKIDSFIYPELPGHNENLPQYDFDVGEAKALLDGAGYIDSDGDGIRNDPATGKSMEFDLLTVTGWTASAILIKEQLGEIGIAINIQALELSTYYSYLYAPQHDLYDIALAGDAPGPYGDWIWEYCRSWKPGSWNTAYYKNPEFDETLDKYLSERDLTKRREYLYEMQMMIAEDLPYGFLCRWDVLNPVSDKFEGYVDMMGLSCWVNPWTFFKVHLK